MTHDPRVAGSIRWIVGSVRTGARRVLRRLATVRFCYCLAAAGAKNERGKPARSCPGIVPGYHAPPHHRSIGGARGTSKWHPPLAPEPRRVMNERQPSWSETSATRPRRSGRSPGLSRDRNRERDGTVSGRELGALGNRGDALPQRRCPQRRWLHGSRLDGAARVDADAYGNAR